MFIFTVVLPALIGTAVGSYFVRTAWQKMQDDELRNLETNAELMEESSSAMTPDNSLARRVDGSGLGLTIARGLARGMGGDLTYAHRPGGGSILP